MYTCLNQQNAFLSRHSLQHRANKFFSLICSISTSPRLCNWVNFFQGTSQQCVWGRGVSHTFWGETDHHFIYFLVIIHQKLTFFNAPLINKITGTRFFNSRNRKFAIYSKNIFITGDFNCNLENLENIIEEQSNKTFQKIL